MQFSTKTTTLANTPTSCLVLGVYSNGILPEASTEIDKASSKAITKLLKAGDMSGKINEAVLLHNITGIKAQRILLVGCGKKTEFTLKKFTETLRFTASQLQRYALEDAVLGISSLPVEKHSMECKAKQIAKVFTSSEYRYKETLSTPKAAGHCLQHQGTPPGQKGTGHWSRHCNGYE